MPCWLVCNTAGANDDIFYNAETSFHSDDNVSTAWRSKDVREDTILTGVIGASYASQLTAISGLNYRGGVTYEAYSDFDDLNAIVFEGGVDYRFRPGGSFFSPTWTAGITLQEKLSGSDIRDSTTIDLKLEMFRRHTEIIAAIYGIGHTVEEAEGTVFDGSRTRLFANVDYMLDNRRTLFLTYIYMDGDVTSTATPDSLLLTNAAAGNIEPDDAFGGGTPGGPVVYRLDATTQIITLGYNMILDKSQSIDLSMRTLNASAVSGIEYDSLILRASYLLRFK